MEEIAIEAKNISKSFRLGGKRFPNFFKNQNSKNKKFFALENVSFKVPKGKMYGIIGLNGSGKTTLLRILSGIYKPDSGSVMTYGRISPILSTGTGFNDEFAAKENIIMSGIILGMKKPDIIKKVDKIIEFAELEKFRNQKLKHYSTGMKARLACSTALEINPDILLLDEILRAGDIKFKEKSYQAFLSFKERKKTILFTTHSLGMAKRLCDKVLLLHKGKLILEGDPIEVIKKYENLVKSSE